MTHAEAISPAHYSDARIAYLEKVIGWMREAGVDVDRHANMVAEARVELADLRADREDDRRAAKMVAAEEARMGRILRANRHRI